MTDWNMNLWNDRPEMGSALSYVYQEGKTEFYEFRRKVKIRNSDLGIISWYIMMVEFMGMDKISQRKNMQK